MNIKHFLFGALLLLPCSVWSWGPIGHRVVGQIAENHLSKKVRKQVARILGPEDLAMVSTWMDFVRSDPAYNFMSPWHYVSIPDGQTYQDITPPQQGDVIATIERLIQELKTKQFTHGDEAFALKCLVHLVGDIHQPLHVGRAEDRGGNDIRLRWFREETNLHRLWDTHLIDHQQLSYTEFTKWIDHASKDQVSQWQSQGVRVWAQESMDYRSKVYELPEDGYISYRYNFEHIGFVKLRLLQAGIRLAGILNDIYG